MEGTGTKADLELFEIHMFLNYIQDHRCILSRMSPEIMGEHYSRILRKSYNENDFIIKSQTEWIH